MADQKPPTSRKISQRLEELVEASKIPSSKVTLSTGRRESSDAEKRHQAALLSQKVEDRVMALPRMKERETPRIFEDFIRTLAPWLRLAKSSWNTLEAFSSIDVNAERVAAIIRANPYLEYVFRRVLDSKVGARRRAELDLEKLESAVVLLGMQNSRDLIIALQLVRLIRGEHPGWGKEGELLLNPRALVSRALRSEEASEGDRGNYADTAYAAGLLFDVLAMAAEALITDRERKDRVVGYIHSVYEHGLASAKIATEMVRQMPAFSHTKFIFSAALIHDAGKAAMAILDPRYVECSRRWAKAGLSRGLRPHLERRHFGVDHTLIGLQVCYEYRLFREVRNAVAFHHEPFLLRERLSELRQLASVVSLASNIASHPRRIEKASDPSLALWFTPELKGLSLDWKIAVEALAAAKL